MITDTHRHMWSMGERYRAALADSPGWYEPPPSDFDWERTTSKVIEEMDSAGVRRSLLVVADLGVRLGEGHYSLEQENRYIAEAQKRYPERIVALYGTDPRRPSSAANYERAITSWNVTGIKLHPAAGFSPEARMCYPLYELSNTHRLPVLFHTGPIRHPKLADDPCHPLKLEKVAADFPGMTILVGHAGGDWWRDALDLARRHLNVILELSGWQKRFKEDLEGAVRSVHEVISLIGSTRVVWGSDFPGLRSIMSLAEWVGMIEGLPTIGRRYGIQIAESDVEGILVGNPSRILATVERRA